ncbi:MAG: transposase [Corynebacterium variabile]|uniref:transposase n=1 Tax=Corynebacterium variabile TaxID=1727 RepID=UPI003F94A782
MLGVSIKSAANIFCLPETVPTSLMPRTLPPMPGTAPVTRRSGTSIRRDFPSRSGNKRLNHMSRSAWLASNCHPTSRSHYKKKRA